MTRFSANLGYLWTELPLVRAIHRAADQGFDAVEFHYPYDTSAEAVRQALTGTGLQALSINTRPGDGEMGFAAITGAEDVAWTNLTEALDYAEAIGAGFVHVLAGRAEGRAARETFVSHLARAGEEAASRGLILLIEPLNAFDAPGYFLNTLDLAERVLAEVNRPNVKLLFDCYHAARTEGDVTGNFARLQPLIGHVQFAGVPDRGLPDAGDVDYRQVFAHFAALGWDKPLGAEYRPPGATEDSLAWMQSLVADQA